MTRLFWGRPTVIWSILVLATLTSFEAAGLHLASGAGFTVVMVVAAFKARLIARHFMELKHAPRAWRIVFDVLIGVMTMAILGLHLWTSMQ